MMRNYFMVCILVYSWTLQSCGPGKHAEDRQDSTLYCIEPGRKGTFMVAIVDDTLIPNRGQCISFDLNNVGRMSATQHKMLREYPVTENGIDVMDRVYDLGIAKYENPSKGTYIRFEIFYLAQDAVEMAQIRTDAEFEDEIKRKHFAKNDSVIAAWEADGVRSPKER